jgi:predicted TIM-barrel fold metal-dependent hydrolase
MSIINQLSPTERDDVLGGTATRIYRLTPQQKDGS